MPWWKLQITDIIALQDTLFWPFGWLIKLSTPNAWNMHFIEDSFDADVLTSTVNSLGALSISPDGASDFGMCSRVKPDGVIVVEVWITMYPWVPLNAQHWPG